MWFQDFQDGRLASWITERNNFSDSEVTPMLPIKFRLNPTYGLGEDSRWLPWQPSWIWARNNFSNSKSVCRSDASHQV